MENLNAFASPDPYPHAWFTANIQYLLIDVFPILDQKQCIYLLKDMVQDRQVCEGLWYEAEVKSLEKGSTRDEGRRSLAPARCTHPGCQLSREVLLEPATPTHAVLQQLLLCCLQRGAAATGLWSAKTRILIQLGLYGKLCQPLAHATNATVEWL